MRLRLNTTLRAALIAAITAVGFTLTQAEAADTTLANIMNTQQSTAVWGDTGLHLTSSASCTPAGVKTNTDYTRSIRAVDTNVGTGGSYTYTLTFQTGTLGDTFDLSAIAVDFVTFNGSGAGHNQSTEMGVNKIDCSWTLTPTGSAAISGTLDDFELPDNGYIGKITSVYTSESGAYTSTGFTGGTAKIAFSDDITLASNTSYTLTLAVSRAGGADGFFVGIGNIALINTVADPTSTWIGGEGHTTWSDSEAWNGDVPTEGTVAVFDANGTGTTVTISSAAQALSVNVSGKEYTFTVNADGSFAAGMFSVLDGSQTVVLNGGSFTPGTIAIATGSTLTIDNQAQTSYAVGKVSGAGDLLLTTGTFSIGNFGSTGKLVVNGATLELGDSRHTIGTLEIGNGGVVNATGANNANGCVSGDINIKAGGTFKMIGHHDGFGWGDNATKNIILTGESDSKLATLELNQTSGGSATMKTNIAMHGYSKITSATDSAGFNTYGGAIVAENTHNTIDKIQLRSDATIEVKASGDLSVGNMVYGQDGNHNLTKTGEGTLTFTGAANMNSLTHNAGSISFQGATTIAGNLTMVAGATVTNSATLTFNNSGTIKIAQGGFANSGTVNFSSSNVFDLSLLTDNEGVYTLFTGTSAVDLSKYSFTASNITGVETIGKNWTFGNDGTISYTTSLEKTWTGGFQATWNHTDPNWNGDSTFNPGDSALFADDAYLGVDAPVTAVGIRIADNAGVALWAEEGGSLSANTLIIGANANLGTEITINDLSNYTVGTGSTWNIGANQTLGAGTNNGTIVVGSTATVTISGTTTAETLSGFANSGGTLSVALANATDGNANIVVMSGVSAGTPSSGTFELRSGTIDYRSNLGTQTLKLNDGTRLLFGKSEGDSTHTYAGDIEVAGNATIRTHGASQHPDGTTISGNVTGNGTLTRENDGNRTMYFTGTVNIGGYTNADTAAPTDFQGATTLGTLTAGSGTTTKFSGETANFGTITMEGNSTVEIATKASVSTTLDLSKGNNSTGTVKVKSGGELTVNGTLWGRTASHLLLEENGILNIAGMKIVGTAVEDTYTELAALEDNKTYSITGANWGINDATVIATQNIEIGNELYFSSVDTASYSVALTNDQNLLMGATVGESGSFSMTGGALLSVIESAGSVTLSGIFLDDEIFTEQGGGEGAHYDLEGKATEGANYYLGTADKYVTVVDGGTSATGTNITWGDTAGLSMTDGKIVTEAGQVAYETFYVNADTVNVSAITNTGTTGVQVAGGTLVVDTETPLNITVTDEGTITGEHADATQIGIAKDGCAHYAEPVEASGVKFTAAPEGDVLIVNNGETAQKYAVTDRNMDVKAQTLEMTKTDGDVTVSNTVYVDEIVNTTGRTLTLDNVEDTLELVNMDITASTARVYTDLAQDMEATVSISGVLEAGGGTLLANLTIVGGAEDAFLWDLGGTTMTLGSTLALVTTDGLIQLDDATMENIADMQVGDFYELVLEKQGSSLNYEGGDWWDEVFTRSYGGENALALVGDYRVGLLDNGNFGVTKSSNVPEPTTGTLSLLALAALAARRCRK